MTSTHCHEQISSPLPTHPPLSNESIREAVRLWRHDQAQATEKYNHINKWNTSQVTDMRGLFMNYKEFNDNISEWDVSNVTNMSCMFYGSSSFNQDVTKWDVSNVTNMICMFYGASSFDQDVSEWDVSDATHIRGMFIGATRMVITLKIYDWDKVLISWRALLAPSFRWGRRMSFVLFLVRKGYLCNEHVNTAVNHGCSGTNCVILFDIEDIDRAICMFL